jgi:predicted lipid-binding transport protein (Tim44 family)
MSVDLIFFAALALFLGWKLYSVLGRRTGNERQIDPFARPNPPGSPSGGAADPKPAPADRTQPRRIEDQSGRGAAETRSTTLPRERRLAEASLARAPDAAQAGIAAIRAADPAFDYADFVAGAKVAFEMILGAFAAGDVNALKPLLSPDVFQNFATAIAERQRLKHKLKTTIAGITGADLLDADLRSGEARITLKFTSQQVNVTEDAEGRIVDGQPNEVATIVDVWSFARLVASRDPNWSLVATESPN